jgi:DNA-directed RNA polymerase subunit RPC12/RpoP
MKKGGFVMALMEYKCLNCDGAITFDSGKQQMVCPFCDSEFEVETLREYDALLAECAGEMKWDEREELAWHEGELDGMRMYSCKSCAGEILTDATTAASSCPYCGNQIVMAGNLSGALKPDYVIPFKLNKAAATAALTNHLSKKRLLPKCFKEKNKIDELKGVYVPFWLYDADASGTIIYKATKVRTWMDSRFTYTETRHFRVIRGGRLGFSQVPVDGSTKVDSHLMESIEPFDMNASTPFQSAYLAGYMADKYDIDSNMGIRRANERIHTSTEDAFRKTVTGYTTVATERTALTLTKGTVKYAFFPVWLMQTDWKGKKYFFAMNGQTGKFVGNLPVDWGKFFLYLFYIFLIFAAILNGGAFLFMEVL